MLPVDDPSSAPDSQRPPTRRARTRAIVLPLAALVLAAAAFILTYALRPRPHIPDADDEVVIGPDWHKPAHPWSQVEEAQRSKVEGLEACRQKNWQRCYELLLMAQGDDPALEHDQAVVEGIEDAVNALTDESNRYYRDHPGL